MSTLRPKTSIGFQLHTHDDTNDRRASFDPATLPRIGYGRPQTPVSGLPYTTVRRLKQQFDSGAKIVSGLRRVLEYKLGEELPDEEVAGMVDWLLSDAANTRTFTQLTNKDMPLLFPSSYGGNIKYDPTIFAVEPTHYFHLQLNDLIISAMRDKEAGCRLLIGHYICHAIKLAKQIFEMPRLVFHSEVDVEPQNVDQLGWLGGILDFAISTIKGHGSVDNEMTGEKGGLYFIIEHPHLIILEAKRSATVLLPNSEVEVLGQMRALMVKYGDASRTGILTDSYTWQFFHLDENLALYSTILRADSKQSKLDILAMLTLLSTGMTPKLKSELQVSSEKTDALFLLRNEDMHNT